MKIKCPVCKSSIKFVAGTDPDIACTKCDTIYSRPKIEAALAKMQNANAQEEQSEIPIASLAADNENSEPGSKPIPDADNLKAISPTLSQTHSRRKNRNAYLSTGLIVFCLALCVILFFVIKENVFPGLNEVATDDPPPPLEFVEEVRNEVEPELPDMADEPTKRDWSKTPFGLLDHEPENNPFPTKSGRFKSQKTMADCWFVVKPYLLELQAETATGPGFATGIIIDSRGWVLTSFRAVAGASTIHVRRARQTANDPSGILSDTVRGYIAVDPERDLAILSINRRLIDAFEDLAILDEDRLVESEHIIQCQSPTVLFPKTTCESRILKRAVLGEFGELDQARLKRQKIDAGIRWIIHQQYSPLRYGAPIVNDQGSLVAMNTGFRTGNKHDMLSIPSSELLKFKNSADDTVKPLPIAGSEKIPVASNALPTGNKEPHSQSAESDVDLVEKLSRLGKDCEIFGWLPQTENDETTFRDFISTFVALKQILDDEQESESFDSIKAKLDDWQNKIDASLGSEGNLDRDQQETFNQRFADVAKKNDDSFVGFVYVKFAALESPMIGIEDPNEKRETISLEFKGTEVSIITNVDPSWRPMPPDSPWLIIGRRLGGTVRIVDRDNNRESFHMTKVMTVIQSN